MTSSAVIGQAHRSTLPCVSGLSFTQNWREECDKIQCSSPLPRHRWAPAVGELCPPIGQSQDTCCATNQGVKLDQETFWHAGVEESGRPGCSAGYEMAGGNTIRPKCGWISELVRCGCGADAVIQKLNCYWTSLRQLLSLTTIFPNCSIINTMTRKIEITALTITNVSIWNRNLQ